MLCLIHTTPIVESNKILDSFAKMMQYPTAVSLSHRLELKGIVPSLVTLNILINCFCRMGQITFGFSVLRPKILKRSYEPDTITLNTLIKGDTRALVQLLGKIDDSNAGIRLDVYTLNILLDGLCKGKRLKIAQGVFQDLLVKGYCINVYTYTIMINGLCKQDLLDEALAMLSKMEGNGCIPNAFTFEILICALFEKDGNDKAEKLLREMIARGLL
ncbi:Putative pentatricopeptide repeat-containing protein, mitochondrial [Glycine soja]|uniref:Putative pentatricopeptide repeat-containing protein, mitochondrial n=1 Tax=Glycine soja TaxID=3848 RepID=A0A0B2QQC4_GLYSO|nr:Putative pentatricopeptide repeat-containing protein, mitochondrial [Glycine soja]